MLCHHKARNLVVNRGKQNVSQTIKGKIALVTGGSRNIGRETALALGKMGANIVVTYVQNQAEAVGTVEELRLLGVKAKAIQVNFTGTSELESFATKFKALLSEWGRSDFDILINNAGTIKLGTFDAITEEDLDAIYQINYKSVFFLTQKLMGDIVNGGRIVNLGSGTAEIAFAPMVAYGPIKAAIQSLTRYLASSLGERKITVNAVAPGGLDDDFNSGLFEQMSSAKDYIKSNTAIGRIGKPNDIGRVIAFLCTDEAAFINGAIIPIDGGYHL